MVRCLSPSLPVPAVSGATELICEKQSVFLLILRAARCCLSRVGIVPPNVTITADDLRLRAGKPAPDPFLLAAECLGYRASRCVVFEDSPSGIKAGVTAGAIVVAVCTSHSRGQFEQCGAAFCGGELGGCALRGDQDRRGNLSDVHSRALTEVRVIWRI